MHFKNKKDTREDNKQHAGRRSIASWTVRTSVTMGFDDPYEPPAAPSVYTLTTAKAKKNRQQGGRSDANA